jgi:hypothetical protein
VVARGRWRSLQHRGPESMPQCVIEGAIPYLGMFLSVFVKPVTTMKDYTHVNEHRLGDWGQVERAPC